MVVGRHSWGPTTEPRGCAVGGELRDGEDGSRQLVGATMENIQLREYVETAELGSLEDFCQAAQCGWKAY